MALHPNFPADKALRETTQDKLMPPSFQIPLPRPTFSNTGAEASQELLPFQ